ncbi:ribose-phosphate diphosphokinase [Catenovulum maritimum]|uniref:Ribose-phosphate pyrophosphokinase n=1 Tax=Catenovulum maritimum TaxID=1513271 RepID=A0A0J8GYH2_9ALTE|nr:ribose-phosphate diphosphokinase [Catenovulum maritimum]KMT66284.1 ribose-phosphate pyrophosphokinase [Catenovulum maritimum]
MRVYSHQSNQIKSLLNFECFTFSGGEEHIRFDATQLNSILDNSNCVIKFEIVERLTCSAKLIRLMLAVDALKRLTHNNVPIELVIPYFPYARQDRVCVEGEALGAAVMATFINQLNFAKVTIWDAHSDVTPALINNVVNVPQVTLLKQNAQLSALLSAGELTLISPDAGATKKTMKIAESFNGDPDVVQAQKVRNLKTGEIDKTEILGDVKGKKVLIADDICDGGRTFIELAKVLKNQGASTVSLFITHGIFSKGLGVFEGLIDHIYTTDSFKAKNEFVVDSAINLTIIEL